ncbi:MAG: DUF3267 domain-containing protein [Bacilli bacterium]|nr:DUF3267 domain-containing protein [Bacilli bacterium]
MQYYNDLPNGYVVYKIIDAEKKKTAIYFSIGGIIITIISLILLIIIKKIEFTFAINIKNALGILLFGFILIANIFVHELTHGLFYKLFTKQKLKFGFTKFNAYCGAPNIYMKRNPMIIISLAPFIIYSIISILLIIILPPNLTCFFVIIYFSNHIGGCIGDIYVAIQLIFNVNKNALVNDTGQKQTIYKRNAL